MTDSAVEQGAVEQGQAEGDATDRARVRRVLIDRVEGAGLVRARGVSAEAHRASLGKLADKLGYMSPDNLETLAEVVIDNAGGRAGNEWPSEKLVRQWAQALQPAPPQHHRIVTSWLASKAGPEAEAGGYLVELYRFLLRRPVPPGPYDLRLIGEQAAENNRRCGMIRDRIARDCATTEDRGWLAAYVRDQGEARRVMDDGRARREAKGKGDGV
jgi:hypothetical protein